MRHVFVETNFIVELVRPFPEVDAARLYARKDIEFHVPWAAVVESKRTLERIIRAELNFDASLLRFAGQELRDHRLSVEDKQVIDRLAERLKERRSKAIRELSRDVDATVEGMTIIEPSEAVVRKTLGLYEVKSLPPFDEMIMGAVLVKAEELLRGGQRGFFFCNKNWKDFGPAKNPALAAEYERLSITYLPSFKVPRD